MNHATHSEVVVDRLVAVSASPEAVTSRPANFSPTVGVQYTDARRAWKLTADLDLGVSCADEGAGR